MGILETLLAYKQQKESQRNADISSIPSAAVMYQQGQQQKFDNIIKGALTQATLAKSGMRFDQGSNSLINDQQIGTPLDQLKQADILSRIQQRNTTKNLLDQFMNGSGGNAKFKSATVGGMTFENPDYVQQKEDMKVSTKAKNSLDEYASNSMQVLDALDRIEKQSEELGDFERGPVPQAVAKTKMAVAEFGKDEKVSRYIGTIQRELIPLARKVAEEKGPITEFDVARLEKAFGSITTPLEDKKFLINEVRSKIKEAMNLKKSSAKISDEEFSSKYGDLKKKMNQGNDKLELGEKFQGKTITKIVMKQKSEKK